MLRIAAPAAKITGLRLQPRFVLKRNVFGISDPIMKWLPRIAAVIFIAYILRLSLSGFGGEYDRHPDWTGIIYRSIPAVMLVGVLLVSWFRKMIGGLIFMTIALTCREIFGAFLITRTYPGYGAFIEYEGRLGHSVTLEALALTAIGALFLFDWVISGEMRRNAETLSQRSKMYRIIKEKKRAELNS